MSEIIDPPIEIHESSLGFYEIYDNYIIATFNEGVDVDLECAPEIIELLSRKMHKPFGWISNKVNSYSANPLIMRDVIPKVPLFKSYCGVIYGNYSRDYTKMGKSSVPENFCLASFNTLDDGVEWTKNIVNIIS